MVKKINYSKMSLDELKELLRKVIEERDELERMHECAEATSDALWDNVTSLAREGNVIKKHIIKAEPISDVQMKRLEIIAKNGYCRSKEFDFFHPRGLIKIDENVTHVKLTARGKKLLKR